jgi:hypothetical protein
MQLGHFIDLTAGVLRAAPGHKRSANHVDGLHRTRPMYLNKRTRAGSARWGQLWASNGLRRSAGAGAATCVSRADCAAPLSCELHRGSRTRPQLADMGAQPCVQLPPHYVIVDRVIVVQGSGWAHVGLPFITAGDDRHRGGRADHWSNALSRQLPVDSWTI